ncbi:ABC transporter permease [Demequina lignilytica]|uniref:ABC transporter permease n=1 Tax=Demequina lignilytica TaxID=3051663 RepID=A0AAW7M491_9MICO|nr:MULTISPECIES: ABC transporter permease [unclassified Demequina]MDN4478969.1 ABC transporter permease [Demequina sp. SYSU T00039-1]MDN4482987.1 ABC transporter permease [Demequina sp. SYSU T0a273]MDN4488844.1 ABC transporter permease [Demequina sp. SYSU T00039]MDN4491443.1 ABC transporter permease [Demequina sp. SYSU T00068]
MGKLVLYRLGFAVPQLLVVSVLVFSLTYLVPGSPAAAILGVAATPESIAQVEQQLGLDRPPLERMVEWFGGLLTGDLGTAYRSGLPVTEMLAQRMPATLSMILGGMIVALVIGVGVGVYTGTRPGTTADRVLTGGTVLGIAIPEFWLGMILTTVFASWLGWLPIVGWVPLSEDPLGWLRGLILPSLTLGLTGGAIIARQTRAAMVSALAAPYTDTLTAAGVSRGRVLYRYGVKNALVPVLASAGVVFAILIGVSFVIERVFSFPGLGSLMLTSTIGQDFPVVQGVVLLTATLVIAVNLLLDICYGLINPQARPA